MANRWSSRFFLCFFFLLALMAISLDFYLASRQRTSSLDLKEKELQGKLHLAVLTLKNRMETASASDLQEAAREIARLTGDRVTILSPEGRSLGDSHRNQKRPTTKEDLSYRPEILAAKSQGYGRSVRFSQDFGTETLFIVLPVEIEGKTFGYVRLASSLASLAEQRTLQRRAIYSTAGTVAFLALILAFFLGRRLRQPIEELTEMVRGLEQEDFRQPFHLVSAFETRALASALESLAAGLSEKMERLEKETGELKTLMAVMREGVLVTDEKGRILLINAFLNEVLGGKVSWLRRSVQEAFMNAELQDAVDAVLKGLPFQQVRTTLGRENPRHFEVQVVALNPPNRQRRAVALFHETTELLHLLEVRRRFVANASWELEKPLTAILQRLEELLPNIPEELKDVREALGSMQKELRRLILLVSEMLVLAQLDVPDRTTAERELVPVRPLLKEAEEWIRSQAQGKGLEIVSDWEKVPEGTTASWERPRILQALIHLLDNAVKYTPPGGRIRFTARRVQSPAGAEGEEKIAYGQDNAAASAVKDFIEIETADTGPGIPKEHLPRIFERFYRVDREYSRRMGGTGLGLAIVKHIVEDHGGVIQVQSEPGRGSVFTVLIPLEAERKNPGRPLSPLNCRL